MRSARTAVDLCCSWAPCRCSVGWSSWCRSGGNMRGKLWCTRAGGGCCWGPSVCGPAVCVSALFAHRLSRLGEEGSGSNHGVKPRSAILACRVRAGRSSAAPSRRLHQTHRIHVTCACSSPSQRVCNCQHLGPLGVSQLCEKAHHLCGNDRSGPTASNQKYVSSADGDARESDDLPTCHKPGLSLSRPEPPFLGLPGSAERSAVRTSLHGRTAVPLTLTSPQPLRQSSLPEPPPSRPHTQPLGPSPTGASSWPAPRVAMRGTQDIGNLSHCSLPGARGGHAAAQPPASESSQCSTAPTS